MGNFCHHDLFFFSNNCNSFSKRATQINSNHCIGQINSTQISNSKNGLFCESSQLSDSRIVDSKQIMAHLCLPPHNISPHLTLTLLHHLHSPWSTWINKQLTIMIERLKANWVLSTDWSIEYRLIKSAKYFWQVLKTKDAKLCNFSTCRNSRHKTRA